MAVHWSCYCFIALFLFRYVRLVVSLFAYLRYQPTLCNANPTYLPSDVTAVIPSVDATGPLFEASVRSALSAGCAKVVVVTVSSRLDDARKTCEVFGEKVCLLACGYANKRSQLCIGLRQVETRVVLLMDDHVWFPQPGQFLASVLAPFEDSSVGGVSVAKKVYRRHDAPLFSARDVLNFIACLYLERHNFDLAASNTVDGGVFVVSGRTAAYRSSIICDPGFMTRFCDDFWFFGVGPLHADDDNFMTRYLVSQRYRIKFQHSPDSVMWTVLGINGFTKFRRQCLRWARTTWRSNSTSVFADRTVWTEQPWSLYAVYLTSFFNFALFTDLAMVYLAAKASAALGWETAYCIQLLGLWILASKLVKMLPHLKCCPLDVLYIPISIAFGYFHSLIKLWALLTSYDGTWGGSRPEIDS